jgi:hypothetical protein
MARQVPRRSRRTNGGARLTKNDRVDAALRRAGIHMDTLRKDQPNHSEAIHALLARNDERLKRLARLRTRSDSRCGRPHRVSQRGYRLSANGDWRSCVPCDA